MCPINSCCRLCLCTCNEFKALQDEYGNYNEIYDIASKYFDTKFLTTILCLQCWHHIDEFHQFQEMVLVAHKNLEEDEIAIKLEEVQLLDKGNDTDDNKNQNNDQIFEVKIQDCNPISSDDEMPLAEFYSKELQKTEDNTTNKIIINSNCQIVETDDPTQNKEDFPFKCKLCVKAYNNSGGLLEHVNKDHPIESLIKCSYCTKTFKGNCNLRRHIRRLHPEKCSSYFLKSQKETSKYQEEPVDTVDQNDLSSFEVEHNFKCALCDKSFKYRVELRSHLTSDHSEKSIIQCLYCEKQVKGKSSMRRHIKRFHPREYSKVVTNLKDTHKKTAEAKQHLIQCPHCPTIIKSGKSSMRRHIKTIHPEEYEESLPKSEGEYKADGKFKCIICEKDHEHFKDLREHMSLQHPGESLYQCPYCPKTLEGDTNFTRHLKRQHPNEYEESTINKLNRDKTKLLSNFLQKYNCEENDNNTSTINKPQYLIDLEYDAFIEKWKSELKCDVCKEGNSFANYSLLYQHFKVKHPNIKCYIPCCGRKILTRPLLVEHIILHLDPNTFKCKICGKTYAGFLSLNIHMRRIHSDGKDCPFSCDICQKRFLTNDQLLLHAGVHSTDKNHICKICDKGFANKLILGKHITRCHRGKQSYLCDLCGKSFKVHEVFKQHRLKHAGIVKPKPQSTKRLSNPDGSIVYVCSQCGKMYKCKLSLTQHKKHDHVDGRKFRCHLCHKGFKYAQALRNHQTTHTGQTPYQCPHCPTRFRNKANIRRHLRVFHPKEFAERNVRIRSKVDLSVAVKEIVI